MGLFRKFGTIFGFTDADDEDEDYNGEPEEDEETDEDDEDEDEEEESRGSLINRVFGGLKKKNSGQTPPEEIPPQVQQQPKRPGPGHVRDGNIIVDPRLTNEADGQMAEHRELVVRMHQIDECREIIKYLLSGDSVLLNLENVDPKDCGRIVDLLSGAAFALSGTMVKVAHLSYLLAPVNVKVIEMNGYGMNNRTRYQ